MQPASTLPIGMAEKAMTENAMTEKAETEGPAAIENLWPVLAGTLPTTQEVVIDRHTRGHHDRLVRGIVNPFLRVFVPLRADPNRPACIICPGGGYGVVSIDSEGDDVARMLNQHGVTAFVLAYRLPDGKPPVGAELPVPIADVHRAIRMVRAEAGKWQIDGARVGLMGFSAGGHVASMAVTQFDLGLGSGADAVERQSSRPDFGILMYPVVSMHDPIAHVGSRHNLLGTQASAELMDRYSADQHVTRQCPPLFICHAEDDRTVPVENSLLMAGAAAKAHVACELVLLKSGGHGFGLGIEDGEARIWPGKCVQWMRDSGVLSSPGF
jgi:acetyl esterase/lipase